MIFHFFILLAMPYLAVTESITPGGVAIIIGALGTFLSVGVGTLSYQAGKSRNVSVEMKEQFMPRKEAEIRFTALETSTATSFLRMEGLFRETQALLREQDKQSNRRVENLNVRLIRKIEEVAKSSYDGRTKMWTPLNETRQAVAALQVNSDVAAQLEKVAEALTSSQQTKVQPTHTNPTP
ncbi:hypothetical protein JIN85_16965 [Luteolibacter pohnpeiensis]|uniref:Uncharacterized protein n=1 Tax=Luteolibacter pohnpeiensis TaxID=454153 RepID=A0A934SA69_9BACT|nr:hypothetical protein [Luteolibacter pohnpeiensis]MBK1884114.1 hypothetical protein [Luteolibacter pohnpeiensis]